MIKVSSNKDVSNDSKFEELSLENIEVLVYSGDQRWFKRSHVGRDLEIARIITSTAKLS